MTKWRLDWFCPHLTHYHNYFFAALARDQKIRLTVFYPAVKQASHPWRLRPSATDYCAKGYGGTVGATWHLCQLAKRRAVDFIVVGGWNRPEYLYLSWMAHRSRVPFALFTDTPNQTRRRSTVRDRMRRVVMRQLFAWTDVVLGTGPWCLKVLHDCGCPENKLRSFPFWVDLDLLAPARDAGMNSPEFPNEKPLRLLVVARHVKEKKIDFVLQAVSELRRRRPEIPLILRIAGDGPERAALQFLAKHLGLEQVVEWLGWCEPADLPDIYRWADCLVHAPRFDPFPVVVLEAMAAGVAILGSNGCGSVRDRVRHGVNGLVHRPGNVSELVDHLEWCVENRAAVGRLGLAARLTAEQWPVDRGVASILNALRECVPRPHFSVDRAR